MEKYKIPQIFLNKQIRIIFLYNFSEFLSMKSQFTSPRPSKLITPQQKAPYMTPNSFQAKNHLVSNIHIQISKYLTLKESDKNDQLTSAAFKQKKYRKKSNFSTENDQQKGRWKGSKIQKQLCFCIQKITQIASKTDMERKRQQLLTQLIQIMKIKSMQEKKRSKLGGKMKKQIQVDDFEGNKKFRKINISQPNHIGIQKQVAKIVQKTNLIQAQNKKIRQQINEEYKSRKFWDSIFCHLQHQLKDNTQNYHFLLINSCIHQNRIKNTFQPMKDTLEAKKQNQMIKNAQTTDKKNQVARKENLRTSTDKQVSRSSVLSLENKSLKKRKVSFGRMMETMKFISIKSLKSQRKFRQHIYEQQAAKNFPLNGMKIDIIQQQWLKVQRDPKFIDIYIEKMSKMLEIPRQNLRKSSNILREREEQNLKLEQQIIQINNKILQEQNQIQLLSNNYQNRILQVDYNDLNQILNILSDLCKQLGLKQQVNMSYFLEDSKKFSIIQNQLAKKMHFFGPQTQKKIRKSYPQAQTIDNVQLQLKNCLKLIQIQNFGRIMNLYDEQMTKTRKNSPSKTLYRSWRKTFKSKKKIL